MRVQRCKGTRDISPEEMIRFRFIEGVFRDCCLKAGYHEIRTPTLEYLHLFTSTGTLTGGMFDGTGQLSVAFPSDGHPVSHYLATDLTGDARDEIILWDQNELWIYTQNDNPRMGNTYNPRRNPLYNFSMHQMNRSTPIW